MTKNEFLDGLKIALSGELPNEEIESNIAFYDDYIRSKSSNSLESDVINQLGDPRLIAKTIIETYQISHGPMYGHTRNERYQEADTTNNYGHSKEYDNNNGSNYNSNENDRTHGINFNFKLTWYQKLLLVLIAIVLFFVVIIVGGFLLQLFFSIGIPLLIVYLGYRLIIKGTKR
jgi:uncharacterized membrane protein